MFGFLGLFTGFRFNDCLFNMNKKANRKFEKKVYYGKKNKFKKRKASI